MVYLRALSKFIIPVSEIEIVDYSNLTSHVAVLNSK